MDKQRYNRLRLLIRGLNQTRRRQAKKIDILCNDMISAQRDFVRRLQRLSFVVDFYDSLMGQTDIGTVLHSAADAIGREICECGVVFFLLGGGAVQIHTFDSDKRVSVNEEEIEGIFSEELVREICRSNKLCFSEDLFAMSPDVNLAKLNKVHFAAVPLLQDGNAVGCMLIYRPMEERFGAEELGTIGAVTSGLSRTIKSCQTVSHSGGSK